jgi:hypothetical protein
MPISKCAAKHIKKIRIRTLMPCLGIISWVGLGLCGHGFRAGRLLSFHVETIVGRKKQIKYD